MKNIKTHSLSELEELYRKKLRLWAGRRDKHLKEAQGCERQMALYEQKLRHIQALVDGPRAAPEPPATQPVKRRRRSPIREATLRVLRARAGQKLTAAQIRTAIRKDTRKSPSRQSINNSVNALEDDGLIRRERAPKGSGAQFVYQAV